MPEHRLFQHGHTYKGLLCDRAVRMGNGYLTAEVCLHQVLAFKHGFLKILRYASHFLYPLTQLMKDFFS